MPPNTFTKIKKERACLGLYSPYEVGKVLKIKVVVHQNYKYKGVITNVAKPWCVVDSADMNANDYRLIK